VLKRPGAHEILEELAETYELVIFTASLPIYANPLLDVLDPYGYIDYRLFRDSCTPYHGALVKDLTKLGRNMKDVIIVDNSPMSFFFQPENAILSKSWM
jgi:RNA polymerase II subunit A small phosphatase-like protein